MRPITVSVGPLAAASATSIAAAQTITGSGYLTLTSSVVTLDVPRRVIITSVGDDTGITFTISGTTFGGTSVFQTIAGSNASTALTTVDFATVTSILTSDTTAGNVSAGTSTVAGSDWARLDDWAPNFVSIQTDVSGTVNYTVQTTLDDPNSATDPVSITNVSWFNSTDSALVGASAGKQSGITYAPTFIRILLNSGSGTVSGTFLQSGGVGL